MKALKKRTNNSEYSLGLAVISVVGLLFVGEIHSIALLSVVNIIALGSVLWSALSVVRHADVLAHRFGEPYGSLILSLSVVVLEVSLISILMLSGKGGAFLLRDTIVAIIMIVLGGLVGISLLLGGRKYSDQSFNLEGINQYLIALLPLVGILLILPISLPGKTFTSGQQVVAGLVCVMMYSIFLLLQTGSQQRMFIYEDEDEDEEHHGTGSPFSNLHHTLFLFIHLIAVIGVVKLNSTNLDQLFGQLNAPAALTGLLIALMTLLPEGIGATKSILKNQVQRAMNLYLGSVLATISLTIPVIILVAFLSGQPLVFAVDPGIETVLIGMFLLSSISLGYGTTNALSGMSHIIMFIGYLIVIFSS